ncbi:MAG TPA: hypothetical protein PL085_11540 [Agriterribacter sp.]|uniref:hypothetical protein n=1 Tax=Agriterribacter sp. TaxID=2821509 RepID=UPI002D09843F|nr:hypothetical protein [Agriterribacter sp.]HRQ17702.1 hypothetical protein [Agriterribacter sp.]
MNVLQNVSEAVTDKPVELTVDILPQGMIHALLQRVGIIPKQKVFKVRQITLGNLIRISGLIISIDTEFKDEKEYWQQSYLAMDKHGIALSEIVAIGLYNRKDEPPNSLIEFVKNNFTPNELMGVFAIIMRQMSVSAFMSSIVLIKGANILQTSQNGQGS